MSIPEPATPLWLAFRQYWDENIWNPVDSAVVWQMGLGWQNLGKELGRALDQAEGANQALPAVWRDTTGSVYNRNTGQTLSDLRTAIDVYQEMAELCFTFSRETANVRNAIISELILNAAFFAATLLMPAAAAAFWQIRIFAGMATRLSGVIRAAAAAVSRPVVATVPASLLRGAGIVGKQLGEVLKEAADEIAAGLIQDGLNNAQGYQHGINTDQIWVNGIAGGGGYGVGRLLSPVGRLGSAPANRLANALRLGERSQGRKFLNEFGHGYVVNGLSSPIVGTVADDIVHGKELTWGQLGNAIVNQAPLAGALASGRIAAVHGGGAIGHAASAKIQSIGGNPLPSSTPAAAVDPGGPPPPSAATPDPSQSAHPPVGQQTSGTQTNSSSHTAQNNQADQNGHLDQGDQEGLSGAEGLGRPPVGATGASSGHQQVQPGEATHPNHTGNQTESIDPTEGTAPITTAAAPITTAVTPATAAPVSTTSTTAPTTTSTATSTGPTNTATTATTPANTGPTNTTSTTTTSTAAANTSGTTAAGSTTAGNTTSTTAGNTSTGTSQPGANSTTASQQPAARSSAHPEQAESEESSTEQSAQPAAPADPALSDSSTSTGESGTPVLSSQAGALVPAAVVAAASTSSDSTPAPRPTAPQHTRTTADDAPAAQAGTDGPQGPVDPPNETGEATADEFGWFDPDSPVVAHEQPAEGEPASWREETFRQNYARWLHSNAGRGRRVKAVLRDVYPGKNRPGSDKTARKRTKHKLSSDSGGHALAFQFFRKVIDPANYFPQDEALNNGPYNELETEVSHWLERGHTVSYEVTIPPGLRPDYVTVAYEVIDSTGRTVWTNARTFRNAAATGDYRNGPSEVFSPLHEQRVATFTPTPENLFTPPTDPTAPTNPTDPTDPTDPPTPSVPGPGPQLPTPGPADDAPHPATTDEVPSVPTAAEENDAGGPVGRPHAEDAGTLEQAGDRGGTVHAPEVRDTRFVQGGRAVEVADLSVEEAIQAVLAAEEGDFGGLISGRPGFVSDDVVVVQSVQHGPRYFRFVAGGVPHGRVAMTTLRAGSIENPHLVRMGGRLASDQVTRAWVHEISHSLQEQSAPRSRLRRMLRLPSPHTEDACVAAQRNEYRLLTRQLAAAQAAVQTGEPGAAETLAALENDRRGLAAAIEARGHQPPQLGEPPQNQQDPVDELQAQLNDVQRRLTELQRRIAVKDAKVAEAVDAAQTAEQEAEKASHQRDSGRTSRARQAQQEAAKQSELARWHEQLATTYRTAQAQLEEVAKGYQTLLAGARSMSPEERLTAATALRAELAAYEQQLTAVAPPLIALSSLLPTGHLPHLSALTDRINAVLTANGVDHRFTAGELQHRLSAEFGQLVTDDGAILQVGRAHPIELRLRLTVTDLIELLDPPVQASETMLGLLPQPSRRLGLTQNGHLGTSGAFALNTLTKLFGDQSWIHAAGQLVTLKGSQSSGRGRSVTSNGAQYGQSGAVEDNRGESLLYAARASWHLQARRLGEPDRLLADVQVDSGRGKDVSKLHAWASHAYTALAPTGTFDNGRAPQGRLPNHTLTSLDGLQRLTDKVFSTFGDELARFGDEASLLREQLHSAINDDLPARLADSTEGSILSPLQADGRPVGHLQIKTTVRYEQTELVGQPSTAHWQERVRVGFSAANGQQNFSAGTTFNATVGYGGEALTDLGDTTVDLGPSVSAGRSVNRSESLSGGGVGIHVGVQRYTGPTQAYRLVFEHEITLVLNGEAGGPVTGETVGLTRLQTNDAYRHGLPVAESAFVHDEDGNRVLDNGEPVLRGDPRTDIPVPGRRLELPTWLAGHTGRVAGAGPGLAQQVTGGAHALAELTPPLIERGFLPPLDPNGDPDLSRLTTDPLERQAQLLNLTELRSQLSVSRLEAGYDIAVQDGIVVTLTRPSTGRATETLTLRIGIRPGEPSSVGVTTDEAMVTLNIGSDTAGRTSGWSKSLPLNASPLGLTADTGTGIVKTGFSYGRQSLGRMMGWFSGGTVNQVTLVESRSPVAAFEVPHRLEVVELDNTSDDAIQYFGTPGTSARILIDTDLLPSTEVTPGQTVAATVSDKVLDRATLVALDTHELSGLAADLAGRDPAARHHLAAFLDPRHLLAHPEWARTTYRSDAVLRGAGPVSARGSLAVSGRIGAVTLLGMTDAVAGDINLALTSHGLTAGRSTGGSASANLGGTQDSQGGMVSGEYGSSSSASRTDQTIAGVERLTIEVGRHYLFQGTAGLTVNADGTPLTADAAVVFQVAERDALRFHLDGELTLPLEQVADAVERYLNGSLELDRRLAGGVIRSYRAALAAATAANQPLPELSVTHTARTLLERLQPQLGRPTPRSKEAQLELVLDEAARLDATRNIQLPEQYRRQLGSSLIEQAALTVDGRDVALFDRVRELMTEQLGMAPEEDPMLAEALSVDLAGKRWWGRLEDMLGPDGFSRTYPIAQSGRIGARQVSLRIRAELADEAVSVGSTESTVSIVQRYLYGERSDSATSGRSTGAGLDGSWQDGRSGTVGTDRTGSTSVSVGEQTTRLERHATFDGLHRVRRSLKLTVELTPGPVAAQPRTRVGRAVTRTESPLTPVSPATLTGELVQLIPLHTLPKAGQPTSATTQPVLNGLPAAYFVEGAESNELRQAILARLAEPDLLGPAGVRTHAAELAAMLSPVALNASFSRMAQDDGFAVVRLPLPGYASRSVEVRVRATVVGSRLVSGPADGIEIGEVNRVQHTVGQTTTSGRLLPIDGGTTAENSSLGTSGGVAVGDQLADQTADGRGVRRERSRFEKGQAVAAEVEVRYDVELVRQRLTRAGEVRTTEVTRLERPVSGPAYLTMFESDYRQLGHRTVHAPAVQGTRFVVNGRTEGSLTAQEAVEGAVLTEAEDFGGLIDGPVEIVDEETIRVRSTRHEEAQYFKVAPGEVREGRVAATTLRAGTAEDPHLVRMTPELANDQLPRAWVHEISHALQEHETGSPRLGRMLEQHDHTEDACVAAQVNEFRLLSRQWAAAVEAASIGRADAVETEQALRQDLTGLSEAIAARGYQPPALPWAGAAASAGTVIVIAKSPSPGKVKTRLQTEFTPEQAAALAQASLTDTLAAVGATAVGKRVLALEGEPGSWLPEGFEVVSQRGDGLDERLAAAFEDAYDGTPMLILGMDTPQVTPELLGSLWEDYDAVLGLTEDGGYWGLGLRAPDRRALVGVPMSADDTGAAQLARLQELGYRVKLLPTLRDMDTPVDAAAIAAAHPQLQLSQLHGELQQVTLDSLRAADAFAQQLHTAARESAHERGTTPQHEIQQYVLQQVLARIFAAAPDAWMLKGGQAMLARFADARPSTDIDLVRIDGRDKATMEADYRAALEQDLGDFLTFVPDPDVTADLDHGGGVRLGHLVQLGGRTLMRLSVDLNPPRSRPVWQEAEVIDFPAQLVPADSRPRLRVISLADTLAHKVSGVFTHGYKTEETKCADCLPRELGLFVCKGADSSLPYRPQDLADILLLSLRAGWDGRTVHAMLRDEFAWRLERGETLEIPARFDVVNPKWFTAFGRYLDATPALAFGNLAEAVPLIRAFLDPLLADQAPEGRWDPTQKAWTTTPAGAQAAQEAPAPGPRPGPAPVPEPAAAAPAGPVVPAGSRISGNGLAGPSTAVASGRMVSLWEALRSPGNGLEAQVAELKARTDLTIGEKLAFVKDRLLAKAGYQPSPVAGLDTKNLRFYVNQSGELYSHSAALVIDSESTVDIAYWSDLLVQNLRDEAYQSYLAHLGPLPADLTVQQADAVLAWRALRKLPMEGVGEQTLRDDLVDIHVQPLRDALNLRQRLIDDYGVAPERIRLAFADGDQNYGSTRWMRAQLLTLTQIRTAPAAARAAMVEAISGRGEAGPIRAARAQAVADRLFAANETDAPRKYALLWVRNSVGQQKDFAYGVPRDTKPEVLRQTIELMREQHPDRQLVLVGDDVFAGRPELRELWAAEGVLEGVDTDSLVRFWEARHNDGQPLALAEQALFFHRLQSDRDALQIGVFSGALETAALLGMPTVYFEPLEHDGNRGRRLQLYWDNWQYGRNVAVRDETGAVVFDADGRAVSDFRSQGDPLPAPMTTIQRVLFGTGELSETVRSLGRAAVDYGMISLTTSRLDRLLETGQLSGWARRLGSSAAFDATEWTQWQATEWSQSQYFVEQVVRWLGTEATTAAEVGVKWNAIRLALIGVLEPGYTADPLSDGSVVIHPYALLHSNQPVADELRNRVATAFALPVADRGEAVMAVLTDLLSSPEQRLRTVAELRMFRLEPAAVERLGAAIDGVVAAGNEIRSTGPLVDRPLIEVDSAQLLVPPMEGFSWSPAAGRPPSQGYMVALTGHTARYPESVVGDPELSARALRTYLREHGVIFEQEPQAHLGGWVHEGELWLEPSIRVDDLMTAIRLGRATGQLAIYDVTNGRYIQLTEDEPESD